MRENYIIVKVAIVVDCEDEVGIDDVIKDLAVNIETQTIGANITRQEIVEIQPIRARSH